MRKHRHVPAALVHLIDSQDGLDNSRSASARSVTFHAAKAAVWLYLTHMYHMLNLMQPCIDVPM